MLTATTTQSSLVLLAFLLDETIASDLEKCKKRLCERYHIAIPSNEPPLHIPFMGTKSVDPELVGEFDNVVEAWARMQRPLKTVLCNIHNYQDNTVFMGISLAGNPYSNGLTELLNKTFSFQRDAREPLNSLMVPVIYRDAKTAKSDFSLAANELEVAELYFEISINAVSMLVLNTEKGVWEEHKKFQFEAE